MVPDYLYLAPGQAPPPIEARPFRAVLIAEQAVNEDWRDQVVAWLERSGCLYFMAWGVACQAWHDAMDWAVLGTFEFGDIPDDRFVMTTWHDKEPLSEAFWFAAHCASHPDVVLQKTLIVDISLEERCAAILDLYHESQSAPD